MTALNMIKKLFLSALLSIAFFAVITVHILPLLADVNMAKAKKYADTFRWKDADIYFRRAIDYDPFNSRNIIDYANFLRMSSINSFDKVKILKDAEERCNRAISLEPRNADGYIRRAIVKMDQGRAPAEIFADFREALKNDPNGYNVAYYIGYYGVGIWDKLNADDKALIADRLKFICSARQGILADVYARTWYSSKDFGLLRTIAPSNLNGQKKLYDFIVRNNLWQFRKDQMSAIKGYDKKESAIDPNQDIQAIKDLITGSRKLAEANAWKKVDGKWIVNKQVVTAVDSNKAASERQNNGLVAPEDWMLISSDNKKAISCKGILNSSRTAYALVSLAEGKYFFSIELNGSFSSGAWPYITIELDGKSAGEALINTKEAKAYTFDITTTAGDKLVAMSLLNSGANDKTKKIRAVTLGSAKFERSL